MIEQLTRYYVPLKDDMSKFEDLCERKRLKKKDLNIIFEHIDIRQDVSLELQKAREQANKIKQSAVPKKKKKNRIEVLMWMSIVASSTSMFAAIMSLLVMMFG